MWGVNGKNHFRSMGHYWLVALLVFQATLAFCDFGNTDSQNLADCKSYLYSISEDVHALGLGGISTDVYYILQELGYMDDSINEIEQDIDSISRQMSKIGDAILTPTDLQIKNQIAVTNVAETFWLSTINQTLSNNLDRIYNKMSLLQGSSFSQFPFAIRSSWWEDNWEDMVQYYETDDIVTYLDGQWLYGDWQTFPFLFFCLLNFDDLPPDLQSSLKTFLVHYGGESYDIYVDSNGYYISQAFQQQYGTTLLQNMATNTFFAGLDVNNFFTNGVFLSQYATNAFQHVADSSGINTNQMFLGSYGSETNADVFADIITNGVELLEGNQVYSSLGDDVDACSLSNKVSMFNFTEKFDDSIKPFLDEIENSSGGDWIINFGNVDLGDHFSFTIPSLTVERNETYLRYVDKFLDLLKIILGVVFFLILWRQLEQAVEST